MADDDGTTSTTADPAGPATGTDPQADSTTGAGDSGKDVDWKAEAERWKAHSRKNEADAKRMRAIEESQKSEAQKLAERAAAAEDAAAKAEARLLRLEVAADKGLPSELAARLQGSTAKELAADADKLLALFEAKGTTAPVFNGGARKTAEAPPSMNDLIRSRTGRG
jgi:hypothetical protein